MSDQATSDKQERARTAIEAAFDEAERSFSIIVRESKKALALIDGLGELDNADGARIDGIESALRLILDAAGGS